MDRQDPHAVASLDALSAHDAAPSEVVLNEAGERVGPATRAVIAASPVCLLGTIGRGGRTSRRGAMRRAS